MTTEQNITWKMGDGDFADFMTKTLSVQLAQSLRDSLEQNIREELSNISQLPGGLSVSGADVQVQYDVMDGNITFDYRVVGGSVSGTSEVPIREHSRGNSEVSSHTRTMENQAIWKLPNDEFITLNSIPQALLQEAIDKGWQQTMSSIGG